MGVIINAIKEQKQSEKNNRIMSVILSFIVGYRNNESGPHILHVEQITEFLLDELEKETSLYKFTKEDKRNIVLASGMHDIGKLCIDENILNKPGKLTHDEYEEMKKHTTCGAMMIESMNLYKDEPLIQFIHDVTLEHHERYDGKGYPNNLVGDNIHIWSQIVGLADVYDALVSNRVYKDAYAHNIAVEMILNNECGMFNPLLIDCFLNIKEDIADLY